MWKLVRSLQPTASPCILTTHYIDEAEEMADRIGVINKARSSWWRQAELMRSSAGSNLRCSCKTPLERIPPGLSLQPELSGNDTELVIYL